MAKTAILLTEFQKNWTDKGVFHQLIKREYHRKNVLIHTKELLAVARENQNVIIHAPLIIDKTDKYRYPKTPFPARLFRQLAKGTWKAEFTDGIYAEGDIVATGRSGYDCCVDSNLVQLLKENKIKNVVLCGFTTENCVKETMIELQIQGFNCVIATDCTAALTAASQQKVEKQLQSSSNELLYSFLKENGKDLE
ncbi:hypothetical protein ATZ33_02085 [Enterococcus silesiacus]|uniref:Isochorismatase-like domain-containing protein n=1 Tax=Enterococcus silesiacus TaxID=332949 RepID=A0A0S3K7D4_9ENTE|nr:cysteine hydrolase [Enterococcus silesiacus]ALS00206.1 hypothetical protein ATZ33_02085 [Enterococcus silesiacus]OJG93185.1 hypothetical protein RV15_GL001217 [Enterococcus silesiacus]